MSVELSVPRYGESDIDALQRISLFPCFCNEYTGDICPRHIAENALNEMSSIARAAVVKLIARRASGEGGK